MSDKQLAQSFPQMLERFQGEIARALPKHLTAERMTRIALTAFRRQPKLGNCDPRSVFAAVIQAAQLGLEPDTLGRSYLIPYGSECQFVPGWKGLVDLVNRAGNASVWTAAVFKGDEFSYQLGDRPGINHVPVSEDNDPENITHVYAVGRVKGSEFANIEVWPIGRVKKHRDRYNKVGRRHYSFENWEMYARKVVLLQVLKYMPASPELVLAMGLNDAAEIGPQGLSVSDAIEGSWVPLPREESDPETRKERTVREPRSKGATHDSGGDTGDTLNKEDPRHLKDTGAGAPDETTGKDHQPKEAAQTAQDEKIAVPKGAKSGANTKPTDLDSKARNTPVGAGQLSMIRTKLRQTDGALTEQMATEHFNLDSLEAATVFEANNILDWIRENSQR